MSAKKKKIPRIEGGNIKFKGNGADPLLWDVILKLKEAGIEGEDLNAVRLDYEHDYTGCYYEDDTPSVIYVYYWRDIY